MGTSVFSSSVALRITLTLLLSFLGISTATAADPTFSVTSVTTNPGLTYLLTSDFNSDGIPDLASTASDGISVLIGRGDGTFNLPIVTGAGSQPATAAVADVNDDSIPDVAVGGDQLMILIGNGDGSFRSGSTLTGSSPGFGEFNQDGRLDIAFATRDGVWIALGNGDGTFGSPTNVTPAEIFTVGPLTTGDFDGDGIDDIAFSDCCDPAIEAASVGHLYVLYGNGAGGVAQNFVEQSASVAHLRTIDLNKDSIDDLAESWAGCHTPCMGLTAHLGNSDRQLHSLTTVTEPTFEDYLPGPGLTADLNLDGLNDLAFHEPEFFPVDVGVTRRNSVFVSLQKSDGTLTDPPLEFSVGAAAPGSKVIVAADFNRDGKPDLAVRGSDGNIALLTNTTGASTGGGVNPSEDFSLNAAPQQTTVAAGVSATISVTVSGSNGFDDSVALSCSGLPTGAACTFSPETVSAGGVSTLSITTSGTTASARPLRALLYAFWLPVLGLVLAGAGPRSRRKVLSVFLLAIISLLLLQACGGDGPAQNPGNNTGGSVGGGGNNNGGNNGGSSGGTSGGTPAGEYQVTITGTSGSLQRTTVVTLVVQ